MKKRRTGTKRNSGNPEWNEQLSFDVQHDLLKQLSVEILVVDRDANEVIGRLIISQTGNRDTKQHWEEMVEGKSGHHPVWYKLSSNQTP